MGAFTVNKRVNCEYFVWMVLINPNHLEGSDIVPAEKCRSPYRCTEHCIQNPDPRYRMVKKDETKRNN